ncbi:unnamed protein product [Macrosiphum euphorbiae]|uniref:Uncharacterized protein n=1 Tax=Macrosiphum euphorbiae TaxID=13131 RepID=A0AAV0W3W0_9HEMI|nr:unnamed protein product [Macrosiphum euphorbiae]
MYISSVSSHFSEVSRLLSGYRESVCWRRFRLVFLENTVSFLGISFCFLGDDFGTNLSNRQSDDTVYNELGTAPIQRVRAYFQKRREISFISRRSNNKLFTFLNATLKKNLFHLVVSDASSFYTSADAMPSDKKIIRPFHGTSDFGRFTRRQNSK